jgi:hypothetical protein
MPRKMGLKDPHGIQDIDQKNTNSDTKKLLQIPASQGFEKKIKMHAR